MQAQFEMASSASQLLSTEAKVALEAQNEKRMRELVTEVDAAIEPVRKRLRVMKEEAEKQAEVQQARANFQQMVRSLRASPWFQQLETPPPTIPELSDVYKRLPGILSTWSVDWQSVSKKDVKAQLPKWLEGSVDGYHVTVVMDGSVMAGKPQGTKQHVVEWHYKHAHVKQFDADDFNIDQMWWQCSKRAEKKQAEPLVTMMIWDSEQRKSSKKEDLTDSTLAWLDKCHPDLRSVLPLQILVSLLTECVSDQICGLFDVEEDAIQRHWLNHLHCNVRYIDGQWQKSTSADVMARVATPPPPLLRFAEVTSDDDK